MERVCGSWPRDPKVPDINKPSLKLAPEALAEARRGVPDADGASALARMAAGRAALAVRTFLPEPSKPSRGRVIRLVLP